MDLLKIYPSGRITACRRRKTANQPALQRHRLSEDAQFNLRQMDIHGVKVAIAALKATKKPDPLGLSSVANSTANAHNPTKTVRARRGSHGISSKSRQQIKDSATLIEERYGKERLAFITYTIPDRLVPEIHQNWTKIIHNLRRRFIRALQKAGLPEDLIMVTEYQEGRLERTGQAVLHLHIVFVGRFKKQHWEYSCEYYKQHWRECCNEYCSERGRKAEWLASTRVEGIKKSCASYLSKYLSKGTATLNSIRDKCPDCFIPSSWHCLTRSLRKWVRAETRHIEGESASTLFDWITGNATTLLKFNRYIKVPTTDGRGLVVGWYGQLQNRLLFRTLVVS